VAEGNARVAEGNARVAEGNAFGHPAEQRVAS